MNDFTKEELEELWFFTELHKNKYKLKYPEELLNKLKSMIDNFCEHKTQYTGSGIFIYCDDCEKVFL